MLDCELCNYYKKENVDVKKKHNCFCEITGFEFKKDIEEYEMEYPCFNGEFNMEQLNVINPKKTVATHVILKEDWKFEYRRRHSKPFENRHNISQLSLIK
jgi:hypothetical protein